MDLSLNDDKLHVHYGSHFSDMQTLPHEEWPEIYRAHTDNWQQFNQLCAVLEALNPATSADESRAVLTAVCLKRCRAYATDTHRLYVFDYPEKLGLDIMIPPRAIECLTKLGVPADLHYQVTGERLYVRAGNMEVSSRLIEGQYPDGEKVIPRRWDWHIKLNRVDLRNALESVRWAATGASNRTCLTVAGDMMHIEAKSGLGNAEVEIDVLYDSLTEPFSRSFNCQYMLEALEISSADQVEFKGCEGVNQIQIIKPEAADRFAILMPMCVEGAAVAPPDDDPAPKTTATVTGEGPLAGAIRKGLKDAGIPETSPEPPTSPTEPGARFARLGKGELIYRKPIDGLPENRFLELVVREKQDDGVGLRIQEGS